MYDGADETAPLISRHCGADLPVPVEASSNQLYVTFTTDNSVNHAGFVAVYAAKDKTQVGGEGAWLRLPQRKIPRSSTNKASQKHQKLFQNVVFFTMSIGFDFTPCSCCK